MIGGLPKSLTVDGVEREIRTDFRVILTIIESLYDDELSEYEKTIVMLKCLYIDPVYTDDACKKACWFIDGGDTPHGESKSCVMSWVQDAGLIFPAVNKVAGFETRTAEYIHWWTFLGYFYGIGEGAFSTVVSIRNKIAHGKKLEKWEREYVRQNPEMVKLQKTSSNDDSKEIERLKNIFK